MPITRIFLMLFSLGMMNAAHAILMRHDVPESKYLAAAKRFPQAVNVSTIGVGTLVGDRWVLTAAHAAEVLQSGRKESFVRIGDRRIEVSEIVIHPDWQGVEADLAADVALLKLAEPVTDIKPAALYREYDEVDKQIWFVGNGWPGNGRTGPFKPATRPYRAATNTVAQAPRVQLIFYFDSPGNGATALEGISGPGDSGGPALLEQGGQLWVIGVSSAGDDANDDGITGNYGDMEIYTRVAPYREWLENVMKTR